MGESQKPLDMVETALGSADLKPELPDRVDRCFDQLAEGFLELHDSVSQAFPSSLEGLSLQ